jgi:hypothetical protein
MTWPLATLRRTTGLDADGACEVRDAIGRVLDAVDGLDERVAVSALSHALAEVAGDATTHRAASIGVAALERVTGVQTRITVAGRDGEQVARALVVLRGLGWTVVEEEVSEMGWSRGEVRLSDDLREWEARSIGAAEEPPPTTGTGRPIWELVVEDMQARDAMGRERYGTPLLAHNGRDAMVDLYQELLDAVVYLRQALEERDVSDD